MTTPPKFDQQLSRWLEDGPVDAPAETLDNILAAFPSLSQRQAARFPWRPSSMSGFVRGLAAIAAVVAIAAGALIVLPRLQPGGVGSGPSLVPATPLPAAGQATPSLSPAPTPAPSPSPSALVLVTPQACTGSDLEAQMLDWQGAAGTRFGTLRLRHTGAGSCLVSGTPGIQLVDGQGRVFLDSANLGNPADAAPARPVFRLGEGGVAAIYLMAGLTNYCGPDPAAPVRLALVLPSSLGRAVAKAPAGVAISLAPCNGPTAATVLHVQVPWSVAAP
jgi:hypothetical protein